MPREKKAQAINQLEEVFAKCTAGIITDYRGLNALEITALRRKLRGSGVGFRVVKNTLARLAADKAGKDNLAGVFEGPSAIAFGYGEITEPARALMEYIRAAKESALSIKGGFLAGQLITADDVTTLSTLPPREVLLSRMLGGMQAPMVNLVSHLASPIRGFIGLLQARSRQLEAAESTEQ